MAMSSKTAKKFYRVEYIFLSPTLKTSTTIDEMASDSVKFNDLTFQALA
jgi:hypothetical protein